MVKTEMIFYVLLYFVPTLLAPCGWRFTLFLMNLYAGWTVIGWAWLIHFDGQLLRQKVARMERDAGLNGD
ncbi:MAG: hypothetical protein RBS40_16160 [Rhodocyclaceae bacterium]|jgi:hypothetical protein|nr:hypothetical protein [Rhodocyclaceae bacterium]